MGNSLPTLARAIVVYKRIHHGIGGYGIGGFANLVQLNSGDSLSLIPHLPRITRNFDAQCFGSRDFEPLRKANSMRIRHFLVSTDYNKFLQSILPDR
jgi:hypothetical protein